MLGAIPTQQPAPFIIEMARRTEQSMDSDDDFGPIGEFDLN